MATGTVTVPISVTSVSSSATIFIEVDTYASLYQQVTVTAPNGATLIKQVVGNGENVQIATASYPVKSTGIYNFGVTINHSTSKSGPWTPSNIYSPFSTNTIAPTLTQTTVASEDQSDNDYNDTLVTFRLFSTLAP
jgi:hypothetical protein